MDFAWPTPRLHVVTGKGGTGKTTVAAAIALALASGGGRTLLLEVEGRQGIAQLFDCSPLPYAEKRIAIAPHGGDVYALAVDPEEALLEYLEIFYNMRRAGSALRRLGAIDFATTIAPGVRDVLLTGKAMEAARRTEGGKPVYDAIVLDAPPTGRITRFLNVNSEVAGVARMGPIHNQANSVMDLIRSPRTAVHMTTLLEEMPVQETLDGIADLHANALPVGSVIVNMTRPAMLSDEDLAKAAAGTLDRNEIVAGVAAAGIMDGRLSEESIAEALIAEAADHAARVALERTERARLATADHPVLDLPYVHGGMDLGGLYTLAGTLTEQGVVGQRHAQRESQPSRPSRSNRS